MKYLASTLAAALCLVQFAAAGDCCQRCGGQCACRPATCKIVCDTKKVKDHFYACECEDFCLPGPGCKIPACCDCCAAQAAKPCGCLDHVFHKHCMDFIFKPKYCHVHHRKKLVKYECEREVPVYKCVVVDLCPGCCAHADACGERQPAEGMSAPATDGKMAPKDEKPMPRSCHRRVGAACWTSSSAGTANLGSSRHTSNRYPRLHPLHPLNLTVGVQISRILPAYFTAGVGKASPSCRLCCGDGRQRRWHELCVMDMPTPTGEAST